MPKTVSMRGVLFIEQNRIVGDHLVVVWIEGIDTQVEYHTAVSHESIQDLRIPAPIGRIGRRYIEQQNQTKGLSGLDLLRGLHRVPFGQVVEPLELVIGPKVTPLRRRGDGFYILRHDLTPVRFTLFDEGIQSFLRIFRFDYVADRIDYIFDGTAIFVVVRTHETVAADPHDGG